MTFPALRRLAWVLILGACFLRLSHWGASVTGDEAYTLRNYAAGTVAQIRSIYNAPNNHVLLSLFLRGIDQLWPKDLVESMADHRPLQAPSVLASMGSVVLLYLCAALLAGPAVALIAAALFAGTYWHLLYSHMLRGYSLACFFNLLSLWLLLQAVLRRRRWALWTLPVSLAAGHYTLPSNALHTAALCVWVLWLLRGRKPSARTLKGKNAKFVLPPAIRLWEGAALLAAAGALTYWAYKPMWEEFRAGSAAATLPWGEALGSIPARLKEWLLVCGREAWFAAAFAAGALASLAWALRRRGRLKRAALLCAAGLFVPLAVSAILRAPVLPVRFYTAGLPFWCLALALGMYGLACSRRAALALPRRRLPIMWAGAAVAALLAQAPQALAFRAWNGGVDQRRAILEIIARTPDEDDFAVVYTHPGDDGEATGQLDWEYYGFAGGLEPHFYIHRFRAPAYASPKRFYILAETRERALLAAADSYMDPWLAASLKETGRQGRIGFFEAKVDDKILADYRAAAEKGAGLGKVQALAGLAAEAARRQDYARAAELLERAKALRPDDPRVRYQLGMARYLLLDDKRAAEEFSWCVTKDTENVHAALYYGDALAGLGRDEESLRWYNWFNEPGHPAGVWMFRDRSKIGAEAVKKGRGRVSHDFSSPAAIERTAKDYFFKGSFERCQLIVARAERAEPTFERRAGLAMSMGKQHLYAGAIRQLQRYLKDGEHREYMLFLSRELILKNRDEEARGPIRRLLEMDPAYEPALKAREELVRKTGKS